MKAEHIRLPNTASQKDIVSQLEALNDNPAIHGMLLQVKVPYLIMLLSLCRFVLALTVAYLLL
jgi:5,10-methylene-tetrahydrofolate dehydrogenase/methenyl tetrahydrofolate cyclohydrolase